MELKMNHAAAWVMLLQLFTVQVWQFFVFNVGGAAAAAQVVLENSCRGDNHDLPFARASIELTNILCAILRVGELCESPFTLLLGDG